MLIITHKDNVPGPTSYRNSVRHITYGTVVGAQGITVSGQRVRDIDLGAYIFDRGVCIQPEVFTT